MNEVKKSLDALSGVNSDAMKEVKQRVLSGKRRQKNRNPIPAAVTALVAAAVLFFSFNVLKDGFSTAEQDDYAINELLYDFMLRTESDGHIAEATVEMKQDVLQSLLQLDALLHYAKTAGYEEDLEAIDETVAEQRDTFYADLDKEGEERKKIVLQAQEDAFGITYDEYFNVLLKWTARAEAASDWLVRHPQEDSITRGEVLGLFQNKHERAIADFMEHKSIPPFDLSVKYEELEGTVVAIEGEQVIITQGFVENAPSKKDKLIITGATSRFIINDASEEIVPGMDVRLVYDALSYPVSSEGHSIVYQSVKEWERIGSSPEPEYLAKNEKELSNSDIETAYEMCVAALTDYYKAVWNGTDIDLDTYIENENLKQYTQKKVDSQYDVYGGFNDPVQDVVIGAWEAEFTDDEAGGMLYLQLPAEVKKTVGSRGEVTEFLVRNINGKLVIVDWYTFAKDSYDFTVRGENETIDNPDIWNDREWVRKLDSASD